MLGSYIATALRRLFAEKLYAAINIAGLAVGLACSILILLFVRHETSFDRHWPDAERIYRISADVDLVDGSASSHTAANVRPAAPFLLEDFAAEIEQTAQISPARVRLRIGNAVRYEDDFRFASATFFDVLKVDWVQGDAARALAQPASVVLTESAAAKYFGRADPLGQTLVLEDQWPLTVTGVIRDLPADTHLSGAAFASFDVFSKTLGEFDYSVNNWSFDIFHTYVRLKPGVRIAALESRFAGLIARHKRPGDRVTGMSATAVTDIHLHGRTSELRPSGSPTLVATFGAVAACILLIACVNFTNLATARGVQRAREVGVRKVLGAARSELVAQFLGEATVYAAVALLFGLALVELLLPAFNAFLGTPLAIDYFGDARVVVALLALVPLVGVLAGSYPALYLSAFDPARVLKGDVTRGKSGDALRGTLVVAQFAISIALLIVTTIVYQQTDFARNLDRGFQTSSIVILSGSENAGLGPNWPALRQRLLTRPEITNVIAGSMQPYDTGDRQVRAEGSDPAGRQIPTRGVDYGFFETYGIDLVAGRTFSEERGTDLFVWPNGPSSHTTGAYVLNELAARELGWTAEDAIGKWFEVDFSSDFSTSVRGPVVGVVANTHVASAREPLQPLVYFAAADSWAQPTNPYLSDATVRVTGERLGETLAFIDAAWAELVPDQPLNRQFLDTAFAALYLAEQREATVFAAFSFVAIVIACLGLVGLASFTTQQRTKEIGIRKVMGGSVWDVLRLLTGQFSRLVLVANAIAWPVAYFLMRDWLSTFAYRIDMSPLVFLGSALAAFALAWLTVAAIAARAAGAKPIRALRYE